MWCTANDMNDKMFKFIQKLNVEERLLVISGSHDQDDPCL